jgi:hypothetical protein
MYGSAMDEPDWIAPTADWLVGLYERKFGGKETGRYRISVRLVRKAANRRRLFEDDLRDLGRALFERGFVLIDMDSFFVVMSANSFVNYRRANEDLL